MTDLRELNSAVQNATFPSVQFAQAVREWIAAATERMEPASEGAKVECPNCLQKVPGELEHWHSGYHDDNCTVEPHYVCEQQISELDDRHNRMASLEAQAKFRAAMDRRAVEIGVDRLVGISAFPVGNCPTCGDLVAPWNKHAKYEGGYTCKPAQPEPAAPSEMPEAVHPVARAVDALITASEYYEDEESIAVCVQAAEDLESFWRTHSQPAPVRMTEELKRVFAAAFKRACDFHAPTGEAQQINQDIAAVRAQAAEVVKLPKVPVADIQWALNIAASKAVTMSALEACQRIKRFLAEIDAAERGAGK